MKHVGRRWACVACGLVLSWIGGCRSSTSPPAGPQILISDRVFAGTIVSGPTDTAIELSPSAIARVHVRWIALENVPAEVLPPINTQSRLIIAPDSSTVLPPSGRLTRQVRFASGDQAAAFINALQTGALGQSVEIASETTLLVPGTTAQIGMLPANAPADAPPIISVFVSPASAAPATTPPNEATIGVQVAAHPASDDEDAPQPSADGPASRLLLARETALVDAVRFADGAQFVAAVPVRATDSPWRAVAAIATVTHAPADDTELEALRAELAESAALARAGLDASPLGVGPTLRSALAALGAPESVRPALLLLTSLSSARIAGDMCLVADDEALAALAGQTLEYVNPDTPPTLPELQWFLDSRALLFMCQAAQQEALPLELQAVLALHTGELARRPDFIAELLQQVGSTDALVERSIAENLIALEDSAPAARVRAYDWLAARNRAPAGYDPLADARSRRDAIDQAMQQLESQP